MPTYNIADLQSKIVQHAQFFGLPLVNYVFGRSAKSNDDLKSWQNGFSLQDWKKVAQLEDMYNHLKNNRQNFQSVCLPDLFNFSMMQDSSGDHPVNTLIGQEDIGQKYAEDEVVNFLYPHFRMIFPQVIFDLHAKNQCGHHMMPHSIFLHGEELLNFIEILENDKDLRQILPDKSVNATARDKMASFSGRAGTISVSTWPAFLFGSACCSMLVKGEISFQVLIDQSKILIDSLRVALSGGHAVIDEVHVYAGIGVEEGVNLPIRSGLIRAISHGLMNYMDRDYRPSVSAGVIQGVTQSHHIPYDVVVSNSSMEDVKSSIMAADLKNVDLGDEWLFTSVLYDKGNDFVPAQLLGTVIIDPIFGPRWKGRVERKWLGLGKTISIDQSMDVAAILDNVNILINSKITYSVRRFISSSSTRSDPRDALVDAVIGLESLFGDRSDLSTTVATCAAKLCEDNQPKRDAVFLMIKKIYDTRSKIVHGGNVKGNIIDLCLEIQKILRKVIIALVEEHPEKLDMAPAERARRILLL